MARAHLWLAALAALLLAGAVGVLLLHRDRSASKRHRPARVDSVMKPSRTSPAPAPSPAPSLSPAPVPAGRPRPLVLVARLPQDADTLYRAQDFGGAIWLLKRSGRRYRETVGHLEGLRKALGAGKALVSRDVGQAVGHLERALAHDAWLGGAHQGGLKRMLGRAAKAHAALLCKRRQYEQCYRRVTLAEGNHATGLAALRKTLDGRARELFEQGYVLRAANPSRARDHWQKVSRVVPPSNRWAKKAAVFLARVGPPKVAGATQGKPTRAKPSASELYRRARSAWLAGECAKATRLARQANRIKYATRHVALIGHCACSLRDLRTARWAYRRLRAGHRNMLIAVCRSKGLELP